MADPRDELVYADMLNEPGLVPPREPLRIRVSPYDTPPPSETGWGGFGAGGRPTGRLFEPDMELAPGPNGSGPAEGPLPPWQGGRLFEPDREPAPPKPQWQPGILSAVPIARGIGSLVQGAKDWFSQPASTATASSAAVAPPLVSPGRGRSNAPFDPMAGVRPAEGYPNATPATNLGGVVDTIGHAATEVLQEPYNLVRAGQDIRAPGATDQQVQQARQQEAGAATNLATNLYGLNAPFAATRKGTAGVFGGPLAKGFDPNKEKLAATMEANGIPAPQIWKETGMVKFADGKWAHEISDLGAYYKGDIDSIASRIFDQKYPDRAGTYGQGVQRGNMARSDIAKQEALLKIQQKIPLLLPDVLHHPELFKKYPELLKMPVSQDAMMHAQGAYSPEVGSGLNRQSRSIRYREENQPGKMARGATFDTLLHEIQHAIAQIEGFAKGSNTSQMLSLLPGTGANKIFQEEMKKFAKPMGEAEYYTTYPATPKGEYANYMDDYRKRLSTYEDQTQVWAAEQAYPRSAGENVAELPPQRKNLTPEQAAAIHPPIQMRVPMDQQFVEYNELVNPAGTVAPPFGPPPVPPPLLPGYKPVPPLPDQPQMGGVLNPAPREMQMSAGPVLRGKAAEEVWRGTEREPKLRTSVHPYSNVGGTPIREMDKPIVRGAPKGELPKVDIEKDLSNAEFIFTSGDANAAGGKLYGSKNLPFEDPVGRHGGPGYGQIMQGKKIEGAPGASPIWASMKGPMGEVLNIAKDVERRGKEPWQVYMTGGKQYLDSSMQMVDTAVQAAKSKGVSATANEHLVNVMRSDWNTAADPKRLFPETGLHDEKALKEWINASPQPQRAKLVKAMDTKQARELGFPNIGELRVWNTDARMLTAPPGSAGLAMARINPSIGTIKSHHPAYDTAIGGTDVKTLGMQVPHQIIAPTMHESRMATLNKPQYYQAAPHLYFPGAGGSRAAKTEPVTNKLKDILQRWMLDNPGGLAVAGTAGGIGSLVDPKGYQPEAR